MKQSGNCPSLSRVTADKGKVEKNGRKNNGETSDVEEILR